MKKILTLLFAFIFVSQLTLAQDNCNPYYVLKKGKKWTTSNYNAKDKYQGKQSVEILDLKNEGGKLIASMNMKSYDKKDELQLEKEVEFVCEDGVVYMDMSQYVPEEMMESFKEMDITMDVDQVVFPDDLSVGQKLPDGGVKMKINGPMTMNFEVRIVDRKVVSEESMKVPAGEFNTYKINSTTEINMMGKREMRNAEWIAKDVGLVRSESYDKNGKLKYYSVLTEYSN